jgi:hypothetical protein
LLGSLSRNHSLVLHVQFRTHQQLHHILIRDAFYLANPAAEIPEGLSMGNIKGEDDALRAFEVGLCYVPKPFLSCGVPNLQSDEKIIDFDIFEFEVNSDGGNVALLKDTFAILGHEIGFAHPTIPDYHNFGKADLLSFRGRHIIFYSSKERCLYYIRKGGRKNFTK